MEATYSLIFHIFVAAVDIYSLIWLRMIGGFRWTSIFFLTIWSVVLQIIAALLISLSELSCLLKKNDSKESKKKSTTSLSNDNWNLYKFSLFHLSFVSTICVGIMFWAIYAIDPHALTPKDFHYPFLLNNMHHTSPWIFSIFQVFIFVKREINSFSLKIDVMKATEIGMVSTFIAGVFYSIIVLSKKAILGDFPYPFLNNLTRIQYGVFNMFFMAFALMVSNISTQIVFKIAKIMRKQVAVDKKQ